MSDDWVTIKKPPTSPPPGPVRPPEAPPNKHRIIAADLSGGQLRGMVCACGKCFRFWEYTDVEIAARRHVESGR